MTRLTRVRLAVDDFDAAFAFYGRTGLEFTGLVDEDEIRRIGHAQFRGGADSPVIELQRGSAEEPMLCFLVDDLEETLSALVERGGSVVVEPHEVLNRAGADIRAAQVRDPSGTLLELRWGRRGPLHAR